MYMSPPDDRELGEYVGERMGDEGDEGDRGGGGVEAVGAGPQDVSSTPLSLAS